MRRAKAFDLPPIWLFAHLLLVFAIAHLFPWPAIEVMAIRVTAAVIVILSMLLILSAVFAFYRHKTTIHPNHDPRKLLTTGPFRLSRHPIYLGFLTILTAVALSTGALLAFALVASYFYVLTHRFIIPEENKMRELFDDYKNYAKQTRRWI